MAGSTAGSGLSANALAGWDNIKHEAEHRDEFDEGAAAQVVSLRRESPKAARSHS